MRLPSSDAERHAVAAELGRELGDEGVGAVAEAHLLEQRRHQVERELEALPFGLLRVGVPPQQQLEPARAPLQVADRRLQPRLGPPG